MTEERNPMAEYIEREKIWPALNAACVPYNRATQKAIESIPAADVRPAVRGHWRSRFYYRESTNAHDCEMHICSECGSEWSYDAETGSGDFNFCPNCGADMREGS